MSVEIAWKQNILVTDFQLLKSLLVVLGFGSQAFVCGFSRQNICSVVKVDEYIRWNLRPTLTTNVICISRKIFEFSLFLQIQCSLSRCNSLACFVDRKIFANICPTFFFGVLNFAQMYIGTYYIEHTL